MWLSRQHPSQQDHEPFYASDATLSFTTNREEPVMDFPKSTALMSRIIEIACPPGQIVLDFFAGSSSLAHATLEVNSRDNGARQYIMIQIDESFSSDSTARAMGYSTIAELSRERIRRASSKVDSNSGALDRGFRALKVDATNMADTFRTPDSLSQGELSGLIDNVKPGRSGEDLLFQVMLDWGLELSLPIVREGVDGREVFSVDDDALLACFARDVSPALVTSLAARKPLRVVFRDSAFATDSARINAEQVFAEVSPSTDVKVI